MYAEKIQQGSLEFVLEAFPDASDRRSPIRVRLLFPPPCSRLWSSPSPPTSANTRSASAARYMGAPRRFVFLLIKREALILSAVGAALGLAAPTVLGFSRVIARDLRIPFAVPGTAELARLFAIAFVPALVSGALAALYPAFRAGRMAPDEAMRKGD